MESSATEEGMEIPTSQQSGQQSQAHSSSTDEIVENLSSSGRRNEFNPDITPSGPRLSPSSQVTITAPIRTQPTNSTSPPSQPTNNNNGEFPQAGQNLFHMRDRLFLALFFRVSLIYARTFPKTLRRFIEFCLLMQSIILLFILGYIHVVYTQTPITCLSEYKDSWPKDGVLRVEITTETSADYDINKSYEKEERLRQRAAASQMGQYSDDFLTMMLTADTLHGSLRVLLDKVVTTAGELINSVTSNNQELKSVTTGDITPVAEESLKPSETSSVDNSLAEGETENENINQISEDNSDDPVSKNSSENDGILEEGLAPGVDENVETRKQTELDIDDASISPSFVHTASGEGNPGSGLGPDGFDVDATDPESMYFNKTSEEIEELKLKKKKSEEEIILKSSVSDFEMFANSVWLHDQAYIVEYAIEYGFLRLSPETRQRLNIPVKIVTLDPSKQACFGDTFSRFLLDNFLGYDDILMASIKNLAESEDNKGYLRNVVTGEQFRFVQMWMARSAYIPSLIIMLVFTVSISMLLRYSHHQIFVFIVDLLNNIEGAGAIHIPAAPLFTVILALVGMEAIMSEFFNDTSTAFYVILIVWIADQYDSVCSHTQITRTYWVRFFYLYHFAFYAYHYRFNGQYGGLALLVSWSFIQHSMVYFYHHYELPTILRQARVGETVQSTSRSPTPAPVPTQVTPVARNEPETVNLSTNPEIRTEPVRTEEASGTQTSVRSQSSINNEKVTFPSETSSKTFTTCKTPTIQEGQEQLLATSNTHSLNSRLNAETSSFNPQVTSDTTVSVDSAYGLQRSIEPSLSAHTSRNGIGETRQIQSSSYNTCVSTTQGLNIPLEPTTTPFGLRHRSAFHPMGEWSGTRHLDIESDDEPD